MKPSVKGEVKAEENKPYSKIDELLGEPQPDAENIYISKNGNVIVTVGEPDLERLVRKAMSL